MPPSQASVLTFIRDYIAKHQVPPTQREIGLGCYLTLSGVNRYLHILKEEGYITITPRRARGIQVVRE